MYLTRATQKFATAQVIPWSGTGLGQTAIGAWWPLGQGGAAGRSRSRVTGARGTRPGLWLRLLIALTDRFSSDRAGVLPQQTGMFHVKHPGRGRQIGAS